MPLAEPLLTVEDLGYPEQLPVVERREDILAAIRDHQVVVIAGETGSGKTTQIPKMCLELGRGRVTRDENGKRRGGQIGHTQPRRIAARSVAERIAEELKVDLGDLVGYQVRFTDQSSAATAVKVMTDGILLNEMQRDRDLRRYDTIIIDEAHERSLNIDFILGYLKQLLPRRPDLKVIVTSATIDPQRFAEHFADANGAPAPIIEVSGRTYPVEVRYRPLVDPDAPDEEPRDQVRGIVEAVEELWTDPNSRDGGHQDVLVFLSGEREIRDAADALTGARLPDTEVLPLYARLSAAEQHRVFAGHRGRRIVLATNVAETSLTVPGIRYVIDTGTARISRYSQRTKVQRLPIEPVSQASANQRSGRCGRVADGVCIRLYSEEDFEARPEFTDPEILRTSLASVILQMTSLGLGDVARFPFVDPPDSRQITDGMRLLEELHAFEIGEERGPGESRRPTPERGGRRRPGRRLTKVGRTLARLPIDPRLGRMLVEADRLGCTSEVLVIVTALSIQDVRERPQDKQAQADQQHARFKDEHSDFASLLNLWNYVREQQRELSGSAFRRLCKREFLHYLRIREWQDLQAQVRNSAKDLGLDPRKRTAEPGADPDLDTIHQALLSGLLSHVGLRDEAKRDYLGARGARFSIQPGSSLFRRQPAYLMSAELVETTRLWARTNARIDPAWAERLGEHLVKRTYSEPRWSRKQAAVLATERVTLYGVPLVVARPVQYGRIDPETSRELFIRHGLVEGDWESNHEFLALNQDLLERVGELEEIARRRDIVVDDEDLFAFYDKRIPADVVSGRHFDTWWKSARREQPDLLTFTEDDLTRDEAGAVSAQDYPRTWHQDGPTGPLELAVTYQFDPGSAADGATVHIPVELLNQVSADGFDWQVPGLRGDLVTALIRALPKATRKHFVPAPDHAAAAVKALEPRSGASLTDELGRVLFERTRVKVPPGEWDVTKVPAHLRISFSVEDRSGTVLGQGKDLADLQAQLKGRVQRGMSKAASKLERSGATTWDFGTIPASFEQRSGAHTVIGYPALIDEGTSVGLKVLPTADQSAAAHRRGVRRLLILGTTPPWKRVLARLTNAQKVALGQNPYGSVPALLEDCLEAAVDAIVGVGTETELRDEAGFEAALGQVRTHAATRVLNVVEAVEPVLTQAVEVRTLIARLAATDNPVLRTTAEDVRLQLDGLVRPGFVADTGFDRLPDLRRYLRAMAHRLEKAPGNAREHVLQEQIDRVEGPYADLLESLTPEQARTSAVTDIAWMIEEYRVQTFAQQVGVKGPVSEKRIRSAITAL
ncbi:ATP-dependent RNA helicase HrpA [Kribbia dieselivorans]|uniref:ATP-dependent RNA helicase HrpA n=1 Tax=Kribbia dieselivorans TaxID=331526 RepID=UPI0008391CCB|nr:ATP-dependent RNA helicase HrpA [Kribbia dieselivorans]